MGVRTCDIPGSIVICRFDSVMFEMFSIGNGPYFCVLDITASSAVQSSDGYYWSSR